MKYLKHFEKYLNVNDNYLIYKEKLEKIIKKENVHL